jgi:hypothetical protein
MPNELLLGMLIGAGAAALLYLVFASRGRRRPTDETDEAGRSTARKQATPNLPSDLRSRPDDLPFVVEKRTTRKITINVNGQLHEYNSLEEVPAEFRALIEKARRTGRSRITIEVNGKRYSYGSRDEVPPEFRHLLPPEEGG